MHIYLDTKYHVYGRPKAGTILNLAKGLYKSNRKVAFLKDTLMMVKKKKEEGLTPFLAPCSVQEIRRSKRNTIEPQPHKPGSWELSPNICKTVM